MAVPQLVRPICADKELGHRLLVACGRDRGRKEACSSREKCVGHIAACRRGLHILSRGVLEPERVVACLTQAVEDRVGQMKLDSIVSGCSSMY